MNREAWLIKAVEALEPMFKQHGASIPKVKVSVGFPGGGSARKRIGEFWSDLASVDKLGSVFISPILDDAIEVLGVLVHELVHASVGVKAGHGPLFRKLAVSLGLAGKMRSTTVGPELKPKLEALAKELGPYPHGKLNLSERPTKKQTTRMIKQECKECEYIVRSSRASIIEHGPVICPGCECRMTVDL